MKVPIATQGGVMRLGSAALLFVGLTLAGMTSASELFFGQVRTDGRLTDILHYHDGVWTSDGPRSAAQLVRIWYPVNALSESILFVPQLFPKPKPILTRGNHAGYADGTQYSRCKTTPGWVIQTDYQVDQTKAPFPFAPTWVASRSDGYTWKELDRLVDGTDHSGRVQDLPSWLSPLTAPVRSQWAKLEQKVMTEYYPKRFGSIHKPRTSFHKYFIQRAVWPKKDVTAYFFTADKLIDDPDMISRMLQYRAWALQWPDGRIEWSRIAVQLVGGERVLPTATLELDERFFLVAKTWETTKDLRFGDRDDIRPWREVYELVGGKFERRVRYAGDCNKSLY